MNTCRVLLTQDQRERLELFNEKADKLLGSRFARDGTKLTVTWEQDKPCSAPRCLAACGGSRRLSRGSSA
jgi:hypothetical protein